MAAKKGSVNKSKKTAKKRSAVPAKQAEGNSLLNPLFIHGAVLSVIIAATLISMYIETDAIVPVAVKSVCGGLFGIMAYILPAIFIGMLIYLVNTKSIERMWQKLILLFLELADICAIIGLFADYDVASAYSICSAYTNGGGTVGVGIAQWLSGLISEIGAFLLLIVLFVAMGCLIAKFNIMPYIINGIKRFMGFSSDTFERVRKRRADGSPEYGRERDEDDISEPDEWEFSPEDENRGRKKSRRLKHDLPSDDTVPKGLGERRRENGGDPYAGSPMDIAKDFAIDLEHNSGVQNNNILNDGYDDDRRFDLYNMRFDDSSIPVSGETVGTTGSFDPLREQSAPEISPGKAERKTTDSKLAAVQTESGSKFDDSIFNTYSDPPVPVDEACTGANEAETGEKKKTKSRRLSEAEKDSIISELDDAMAGEHYEYHYPPLELLDNPKRTSNDQRHELYKKAEQLISVLDNFGVKAKPVQVTQGPTVTRYEIQPSSGTKLSKIVGLADDIALNLAVSTVLIAPVPGKAATVGVEIPNNNVTPVTIREMLESPEFRNAKSKLTVCLGKDIGGNVVVGDIAKWPHALIAGATGSGKSVCINTIIASILYKANPEDVKLIMVDPKQVELGVYNGIPHLLIPVVTEAKKAAGALNWAVQEMMHRYELFKETGVRKLEGYNKLMENTGGEKLPQLVIIIDELADLMMVAAKEVEDYICRLAQLARAAGIHLIIATQRPSVDVITGLIKANIPSRIAFFVSSQVDSRTILDKAGAEKLLGMGDMLYFPTGARSTRRVQGAFVSDGEVERIIDFIKDTSPRTHYSEDLAEHIERIQLGENGVTPDKEEDGDALLPEAIQLAVELGKISTSMVQRRLSVGYSRAGRIIDQMEARGIISPANGSKPRDVLISHADMDTFHSEGLSEDDEHGEE